jgi:kynurenine formamidase
MRFRLVLVPVILCITGLIVTGALPIGRQQKQVVTQADLDSWLASQSNWGRWGNDDQKGALNLITPTKVTHAAGLVKDGFTVSLARTLENEKAINGADGFEDVMTRDGSEGSVTDWISVAFHGENITHINALGHKLINGKMYNGYVAKDYISMSTGVTKDSIINLKNGVFTRGILFDIPRLKGVPYLEPGTPIYVEDLEAWEKVAGVKVSPGDAIFVSTGRWARLAKLGPWDTKKEQAGLDASVIPWLKSQGVALIGGDDAVSVRPAPPNTQIKDADRVRPAHDFALYGLGISVIDDCDLGPVSEAAAARKRWDFLVVVAPLPMPAATGSPINPIAIF